MEVKFDYRKETEDGIRETSGGCAMGCAFIFIAVAVVALIAEVINLIRVAIIN